MYENKVSYQAETNIILDLVVGVKDWLITPNETAYAFFLRKLEHLHKSDNIQHTFALDFFQAGFGCYFD